jgi:SPP1 family predicted phage head-tail adaptor
MRIKGNSPKFLSAELLIEPMILMEPTTLTDSEGGYTVTYAESSTIWGMYVPLGQDRQLLSAEVTFTDSARVYIRYPLTFDNTYKIRIEGLDYTIHSITNIENRKEYFEITIFR